MNKLIIFVFTFFICNLNADEVACTEMACHDGLFINVPNNYKWKPGKYLFQFEMDKTKITCTGKLPFKDCRDVHINCNKEGIVISEVGCALPKINHGFGSIMTSIFPKTMKVKITHNKKKLIEEKFEIQYNTLTPNGPKCEPKCKQANVDLKLQ